MSFYQLHLLASHTHLYTSFDMFLILIYIIILFYIIIIIFSIQYNLIFSIYLI